MKAKEIRKIETAELLQQEASFREELFNLRFQLAVGQLENTARIKQVKKMIAQIKTIVSERETNE